MGNRSVSVLVSALLSVLLFVVSLLVSVKYAKGSHVCDEHNRQNGMWKTRT